MDCSESTHYGVVADLDVTRKRAIVGKDNFVANRAVVTNVTVGEKISAAADSRLAIAFCAAVNGHEFAKSVFVTDFQVGRLAAVI